MANGLTARVHAPAPPAPRARRTFTPTTAPTATRPTPIPAYGAPIVRYAAIGAYNQLADNSMPLDIGEEDGSGRRIQGARG
ncbi:MAG TPA: hypothetical protein VMV29_11195 [Ktedonobacterales bacterium]|nr:hypothetical protein [Ktedonobacterales bacterium]